MKSPALSKTLTVHEVGRRQSVITCPNGDRYLVNKAADQLLELIDSALPAGWIDGLAAGDAEIVEVLAALCRPRGEQAGTEPVRIWAGRLAGPLRHRLDQLVTSGQLGDVVVDYAGTVSTGPAAAVVTLHWYPAPEELAELRRRLGGTVWIPVVLRATEAVIGPASGPAHAADVLDASCRETAAATLPEVATLDYRRPVRSRPLAGAEFTVAVDRAVREATRLARAESSQLVGNQLRIAFADFTESVHPVLPVPDGTVRPYRNDSRSGEQLVVDDRTGIVTQTVELTFPAQAPAGIAGIVARAADMARVGPWPNSIVNGSVAIDKPVEYMRAAAIGEAVERYCGSLPILDRTLVASYRELRAAGRRAVDPEELVLFPPEQYREPGFPFVRFTHDLAVRWVEGRSVTREEPVWVPAGVTWTNYYVGERATEPPTNPQLFAGVAAGTSLDSAACAALEEVLERHATMVWWMHGRRLPEVPCPHAGPGRWPTWSLLVENVFGLPVIGTVMQDPANQLACIGFALRPAVSEAVAKSVAEAASNMVCAADLLDPDGVFWTSVRDGEKEIGYFKPWRDDRRYLDSFAADFRDVGDLESQLQVHCDPRAAQQALTLLRPDGEADLDTLQQGFPRTLENYRRIVEGLGYEVIVVDLTTPDVAYAGYHVVRVVVPGLVSNFAAGFPLTGRDAIARDGVRLGWRSAADPLSRAELNLLPLPHA